MEAQPQSRLPEVILLTPAVFADERGFFIESWSRRTFAEATGVETDFVQDNHSRSSARVLRGIHYQLAPHAQGKLVRVTSGSVWDVAVDLRRSSPTCGVWVGVDLSEANHRQLWIPPGFGHGFVVLGDAADVQYKTTDYYVPELDRSLRWDDPELGIAWPELGTAPVLSAKDRAAPLFADADMFA